MDKARIKYICFYDTESHSEEFRSQSPAAHQKINFVCSLLHDLGYGVDIISPSQTTSCLSFNSRVETISDNISLRLFKTTGRSGFLAKIKRKLFGYKDFKKYVKSNIKDGDVVIVYHSMEYLNFILKLKRKKDIKLIIELEELYSDINKYSNATRKKEINLTKIADGLILPTYTMNTLINADRIPSIVIHGDYTYQKRENVKTNNQKTVKLIYAGTLDPKKGGANNAIKAASLLPNNFELNIAGFGTKQQIENTINICKEQQNLSQCKINFLGTLSNSECEKVIKESNIGLCTQNSSDIYNLTSFPSKILTYLKNGVKVVSCKNESLATSDIADLLFFYESDSPSNIANAIVTASLTEQKESERQSKLNILYNKALLNLEKLLKEGNHNESK